MGTLEKETCVANQVNSLLLRQGRVGWVGLGRLEFKPNSTGRCCLKGLGYGGLSGRILGSSLIGEFQVPTRIVAEIRSGRFVPSLVSATIHDCLDYNSRS